MSAPTTAGPRSPLDTDLWRSPWTYVSAVLRRPRLVLGIPPLVGIAAGLLALAQPRLYVAETSFTPQEATPTQSGLGALASQFGLGLGGGNTSSPLFYQDLLQSREIGRQVLYARYSVSASPPGEITLMQYLKIQPDTGMVALNRGLSDLVNIAAVRTDRTTNIVHLRVQTKSPELSQQIARKYLQLVNEFNSQRRRSQAKAEREFVEQRVKEAKQDLLDAENALARFYESNRVVQAPDLKAREGQLQREVSQRQTFYFTLSQSYETSKIEEVRNTPVITVVEAPEGFIEPKARGTVRKTIVATIVTGFLVVFGLCLLEFVGYQREVGSREFQAVVGRVGQLLRLRRTT